MNQIKVISGPDQFATSFNVSRETLQRLERYVELLRKWQKAVNLIAPSTLDQIWHRHIGDSAQILDILRESDSSKKSGIWLDIGSGGGFPGLVAAIILSHDFDYQFHLVESNGRKCAFLSDVVRHLDLPVEIHNERIEDYARNQQGEQFSIISARALTSLDRLLALSEPFLSSDTVAYFFKGREVGGEIEQAAKGWLFEQRQIASCTSTDGCILEIKNLMRKD
ncbi:MAG: 16S rRNA (guanine(527)-N(7))-methyltransferase RsmG [bacterium]|nr:16S rRNA (guanine(527)-N(7))-methyltransferase RsmG [bacterium]